MKQLTIALVFALTLAGCGAAPGAIAPQRAAAPASLAALAATAKVNLKHVTTKGNGYVDVYQLSVETASVDVAYDFEYTPMLASDDGPDAVKSVKLTLNGKKVGLNDVAGVEAAAKILELAYDKVDAKKRKMVVTAVRNLTWDL